MKLSLVVPTHGRRDLLERTLRSLLRQESAPDFEVPGDEGYGFDDYGFRRSLSMSCFGKVFRELELSVYFPVLPSMQETGARSGCVVLAKAGSAAAGQLDKLPLLRSATA